MSDELSETVIDALRNLPSVDQILRRLTHFQHLPNTLLTVETRCVIAERRRAIVDGDSTDEKRSVEEIVSKRIERLVNPSLRSVINATGIILHTNLGRAPLSRFNPIERYSNLEYDLESGRRGKRDEHTAELLQRLLDRKSIIVNNNAAAVYLVLNELAAGSEVIVSRGELIEIGDGFRIPDIMARSGAILREVGTTNRTTIGDYSGAINERTRLILRVHPSNFHISGFTKRPELKELTALGAQREIPVYEDLGSGCLVDLQSFGIQEPRVLDSFSAGANVCSFSCDKLLGGPQSGIIAGDPVLINRIRRNSMFRAFRVDKLIVEALETTLRHLLVGNWNAIPTLAMIMTDSDTIRQRAERVAAMLDNSRVQVCGGESPIGGGSTPDRVLPTWQVELSVTRAQEFEKRLRQAPIPVIARIERDRLIFDMRTVANNEEQSLVDSIRFAASI